MYKPFASICVDFLLLVKENVIVGRLIPAGTGFAHHAERRRTREQDLADQLKELDEAQQAELAAAAESEAASAEGEEQVLEPEAEIAAGLAAAAEAETPADGAEEAKTEA